MGSFDFGGMGFFPDNADLAHTWINQAGPQLHFRLSRAYCDKSSSSRQTASDQANYFCVPDAVTIDDTHPASSTPNKNFMIAPYKFGMAFDYPGVLETFNYVFSVHMNRQGCDPSDSYFYDAGGCNSAAHLSVGDNLDLGGLQSSSYAATLADGTLDRSQSFVLLASETFGQASHGDMLFALRDSRDNFRFQVGSARPGGANDPATYRNFTLARIDGTGKGFFDGGTQTGGADFAESILPSGQKATYEPGDVLVIDTETDRQVTLSSTPYSTLVAGIYSTKPGVVATIHGSEDRSLQREIPMAIIGIVPCKVSAENGPISRGDLLVTSSTPGYAMRATDKFKLTGAIVGKALQPWQEGTGKIEVLITLK